MNTGIHCIQFPFLGNPLISLIVSAVTAQSDIWSKVKLQIVKRRVKYVLLDILSSKSDFSLLTLINAVKRLIRLSV